MGMALSDECPVEVKGEIAQFQFCLPPQFYVFESMEVSKSGDG